MIGWHDHQHWSKKGKDETIFRFFFFNCGAIVSGKRRLPA
jgi:hypothetical protein